eukprot:TRINITY_DN8998_c0_g3_i2.p1 TRINITY_DN8998_c0_g3~~TRINITY_DN8998_c0_g3_i2.p1  ORF type:complete len:393 (+),score=75.19 TRINITY_DN8998_c0_g3_i2:30-1181(+)
MADNSSQANNATAQAAAQQMTMMPQVLLTPEMIEHMRSSGQNGPFFVNPANPQIMREYQNMLMAQAAQAQAHATSWAQAAQAPTTAAQANMLFQLGAGYPQMMQEYMEQMMRHQAGLAQPTSNADNKASPKKTPRKGQIKTQEDEYASNVPSLNAEAKERTNKRSSRQSSQSEPAAKRPGRKSRRGAHKAAGSSNSNSSRENNTPKENRIVLKKVPVQSIYFGLQHNCDEFEEKGIPGHFTEHSHVNVREVPSPVMKDFLEQDGLQKRVAVTADIRLERLKSHIRKIEAQVPDSENDLLQSLEATLSPDGVVSKLSGDSPLATECLELLKKYKASSQKVSEALLAACDMLQNMQDNHGAAVLKMVQAAEEEFSESRNTRSSWR